MLISWRFLAANAPLPSTTIASFNKNHKNQRKPKIKKSNTFKESQTTYPIHSPLASPSPQIFQMTQSALITEKCQSTHYHSI